MVQRPTPEGLLIVTEQFAEHLANSDRSDRYVLRNLQKIAGILILHCIVYYFHVPYTTKSFFCISTLSLLKAFLDTRDELSIHNVAGKS